MRSNHHICILAPGLNPGGAERLVLEEAKYFYEKGFSISLIVPNYSSEYLDECDVPSDIQLFSYGETPGLFARTWKIRRIIRKIKPDVLFSHYHDRETYLAMELIPESIPYTYQVNGTPLWFRNNHRVIPHLDSKEVKKIIKSVPGHQEFQRQFDVSSIKKLRLSISEKLYQKGLEKSSAVFVLTEQVATEVRVLYQVEPHVVRPGVPQKWFDSSDSVSEVDLVDEGFGGPVILSVSRLDPRKRLDLLIKAFAKLREKRPDLNLVITGSGPDEARLKELASKLELSDFIHFTGYVPDDDIPSFYKSADLFACPAWVSYGLAPLEAYSMGTKVALSTDTGAKEVLKGQPGVAIAEPNEDAWRTALDDLLGKNLTEVDSSIVPTWEEFFESKHHILKKKGLLE